MTCAAAYRHKTDFVVLAVDGRITDEHGTLYTDRAVKFCQAGHQVWTFAGDVGAMQAMMQHLQTLQAEHKLSSVRAAVASRPTCDGEWSAIAYDSREHALYTCESDGSVLREHSRTVAIGSGSEIALGYLQAKEESYGRPWKLADAKLNVRGSIRAAARRNVSVSARCTVLTVENGRVRVKG